MPLRSDSQENEVQGAGVRVYFKHTPRKNTPMSDLTLRKQQINQEMLEIQRSQAYLAAKTFEHLLRTGDWKILTRGDDAQIVPANKKDQLATILLTALKLGYNGQFTVFDGMVQIVGRFNSNEELTLTLFPERVMDGYDAEVTEAEFRRIRVDIDLVAWARDIRRQQIVEAERDLAAAKLRLSKLKEAGSGGLPKAVGGENKNSAP